MFMKNFNEKRTAFKNSKDIIGIKEFSLIKIFKIYLTLKNSFTFFALLPLLAEVLVEEILSEPPAIL